MLDNQETYKHLKTRATAFTIQDANTFVNNLLESTKTTKKASYRLKNSDATTPGCTNYRNYQKKTTFPYDQ